MKKISLTENRFEALKIMDCIDEVCRKYGLSYWLSYGSLIGAVRHHGWIPWDDDIDICMPRKDYLFLLQNWEKIKTIEEYIIIEPNHNEGTYRKCKIANNKTVCTDWHGYKRAGIWVDVFPVDGIIDEHRYLFEMLLLKSFCYIRTIIDDGVKNDDSKKHIKYIMNLIIKMLGSDRTKRLIDQYLSFKRSIDRTPFATVIGSPYYKKECMPSNIYRHTVTIPFEDKNYEIIKEYDYNLLKLYGDYMKLPPEDKRTFHAIEIYWVE